MHISNAHAHSLLFQNAEDEDAEWEKFQKGLTKREKVLEGKSKMSHSVHCPFFTDDKQEFWWVYVCDRKNHKLITVPYHVSVSASEGLALVHDRPQIEFRLTFIAI